MKTIEALIDLPGCPTLDEVPVDSGGLGEAPIDMRALNAVLARTVGDLIAVLSRCPTCLAGLERRSNADTALDWALDDVAALNDEAVGLLVAEAGLVDQLAELPGPGLRHPGFAGLEHPDNLQGSQGVFFSLEKGCLELTGAAASRASTVTWTSS